MRILPIALATAFIAVAGPQLAMAQTNPSQEQIVRDLLPGNVGSGTRGVRVGKPVEGAAQQPVHQAAATNDAQPSTSLNVLFETGSAALTPAATQTLGVLGKALGDSRLAGAKFRIEGHTDTVGSAEMNKNLSMQRAQAVVAHLTSTYGIDAARLTAVGMGQEGLMVQTPPQTAEPRNRRVVIVNVGS